MGLQLNRIDDPRDSLERARRKEIELYAEGQGIKEIQPGMPAKVMRKILRSKGINQIPVPNRVLGQNSLANNSMVDQNSSAPEIDDTEDLMRQWQRDVVYQEVVPEPEITPLTEERIDELSINELRAACKERGIHLQRTDNMISMRDRLNGQDPTKFGQ